MYNIIQLNDKKFVGTTNYCPRTGYKKKQTHSKKKNLFTRYLTNKLSQALPRKLPPTS